MRAVSTGLLLVFLTACGAPYAPSECVDDPTHTPVPDGGIGGTGAPVAKEPECP